MSIIIIESKTSLSPSQQSVDQPVCWLVGFWSVIISLMGGKFNFHASIGALVFNYCMAILIFFVFSIFLIFINKLWYHRIYSIMNVII